MIRIISNEDRYREVYINYSGKNYYIPYGAKIYLKNYVLSDIDMRFFTSGYKLDIACDTKEMPNGLENIYPDFLSKYVNPTLNFLPEIKDQFGNSDIRFGIIDDRGNVLYPTIEPSGANYNELDNKPQINGIQLFGNKTNEQLGLADKDDIARVERRIDNNLDRIKANMASIEVLNTIKVNKIDGHTLVSPEDRLKLDGLPPSTEGGVASKLDLDNLENELYTNLVHKVTYEHSSESGEPVLFEGVLSEQNFTNNLFQKLSKLPSAEILNKALESKVDLAPNGVEGGKGLKEEGNGLSDYNFDEKSKYLLESYIQDFKGDTSVLITFLRNYFPPDVFDNVPGKGAEQSQWIEFIQSVNLNEVRSLTGEEIINITTNTRINELYDSIVSDGIENNTIGNGFITKNNLVSLLKILDSGLTLSSADGVNTYSAPVKHSEFNAVVDSLDSFQDIKYKSNNLSDLGDIDLLDDRYPSLQLISEFKKEIDSELDKIDDMQVKSNLVQVLDESGNVVESNDNTKYPSLELMNNKLDTKVDTILQDAENKVLITDRDGKITTTNVTGVNNSERIEDLIRDGLRKDDVFTTYTPNDDVGNEDVPYGAEYINKNLVDISSIAKLDVGDDVERSKASIPTINYINNKILPYDIPGQYIYFVNKNTNEWKWVEISDTHSDVQLRSSAVTVFDDLNTTENKYPSAKLMFDKITEITNNMGNLGTNVDGRQLISNMVQDLTGQDLDEKYPSAELLRIKLNEKVDKVDFDNVDFIESIIFDYNSDDVDNEHWAIQVRTKVIEDGIIVDKGVETIVLPNATKDKAGLLSSENLIMMEDISSKLYANGVDGFLNKTGDIVGYKQITISDVKDLRDNLSDKSAKISSNDGRITTIENNKVDNFDDPNSDTYPTTNAVDVLVKDNVAKINDNINRIDGVINGVINDLVTYTDISNTDNPDRRAIVLANHDPILGTTTAGATNNLIMMSKWNKVDVGTANNEVNLNGSADNPTYNDTKKILLDTNIIGATGGSLDIYSKESIDTKVTGLDTRLTTAEGNITDITNKVTKNTTDISDRVSLSQIEMSDPDASATVDTEIPSLSLMTDELDKKVDKSKWINANGENVDGILTGRMFDDVDESKLDGLPGNTAQFSLGKIGVASARTPVIKDNVRHTKETHYPNQRLYDILEGTVSDDYRDGNKPTYIFPGKVDKADGYSLIKDEFLKKSGKDSVENLYSYNLKLDDLFTWKLDNDDGTISIYDPDPIAHTTKIKVNPDNIKLSSDRVDVEHDLSISGYTPDTTNTGRDTLSSHVLGISNQLDVLRSQSINGPISESSLLDDGVWLYGVANQTAEHNRGTIRWAKLETDPNSSKFISVKYTKPEGSDVGKVVIGMTEPPANLGDGEFVLKAIRVDGQVSYKWERVI